LQDYPVAIITHKFFKDSGSHRARKVLHRGRLQPRALSIIDERLEDVAVYDVQLSAAQKLREVVQANAEHSEIVGPHMDALVKFMHARSFGGRDLERPTDKREAWAVVDGLQWFGTAEAAAFVRSHSADPDVAAVFGFARALSNGYAFIARNDGDGKSTHYIGYEPNITIDPGTVLLDATADIDGVMQLCPWRQHKEAPKARYDNLNVVSIAPLTKMKLGTFLASARNRRAYTEWMVDTIKAHIKRGQRGLVVCKLLLVENENVPTWPAGDPRFDDKAAIAEKYAWDVEGRKLCVTHWGTGIGSNAWKDADVVFLFDEFWIPRRTVIAIAQGLLNHKATQGPLADMRGLNSRHSDVDRLWEGHLLRWLKQMTLRGKARDYDGHGFCGDQKLVCSADRMRLLTNFNRLFPGAKIEIVGPKPGAKRTHADALLDVLGRSGLPDVLTTRWIIQEMQAPSRFALKDVVTRADVRQAMTSLGWRYVSRKGKAGSTFERIGGSGAALGAGAECGKTPKEDNRVFPTLGIQEAANDNGVDDESAAA
jgi:hypothetical protein